MGVVTDTTTMHPICVIAACPTITESYEALLRNCRTLSEPVRLLVDAPSGFALNFTNLSTQKTIVLTASTSPYYLADLLALQPFGVVLMPAQVCDLKMALDSVAKGIKMLPDTPTKPIPSKLKGVLRGVLNGQSVAQMAASMNVSVRYVRNLMSDLLWELDIEEKHNIPLVYFGLQHKP